MKKSMNLFSFLIVVIMCCAAGSSAAQINSSKQFLDIHFQETDSANASYYRFYEYSDSSLSSGIQKSYFPDGKIQSEKVCSNFERKICGKRTTYSYHSNDSLKVISNYLSDSLHGECRLYFPNGNLRQRERYEFDSLVFCEAFTNDGKDTACLVREIMPVYPGGDEALMRFILVNLKYPLTATVNNIQGRVVVAFMVEPDGSLSNIKVASKKILGFGLEEECIRVVNLTAGWIPGLEYGVPVGVPMAVPFKFVMDDGNPKKKKKKKERRK